MGQPSVLVVGHDASRTGAPTALLTVLRWLTGRGVEVRTVLLDGGPLLEQYRAVAPCEVVGSRWSRTWSAAMAGLESVGSPLRLPAGLARPPTRRGAHADVVVANTLASLPLAVRSAERQRGPVRLVCHVHELDGVADRVLPRGPSPRAQLLGSVDHFVATGAAVADMLTARLEVPADRVSVVDGFIDPIAPDTAGVAAFRTALQLDDGRPLVLDVGAMHRRKGPERFVDLMTLLSTHPRRPLGLWLGGEPGTAVWQETVADLERGGLAETCRLEPQRPDPSVVLAAADVVVSTAIEDPYPLVALEAAALGVPVVGFASGGLSQILDGAGCGDLVVGVGDLLAMQEQVAGLLDSASHRQQVGAGLSAWVRGGHLTEQLAPQWWDAVRG